MESSREAARGGVRMGIGPEPSQRRAPARGKRPADGVHGIEDHPPFGQRAGLVNAQDIHARQAFHCSQLLDEHLLACEPHTAHGEGNAGHEYQSQGNHCDGRAHCSHQGFQPRSGPDSWVPTALGLHLAVDHDGNQGQQSPTDPAKDPGNSVPDF
jgi:hypothetical protein